MEHQGGSGARHGEKAHHQQHFQHQQQQQQQHHWGPKPGDWTCPSCADLQFARNAQCRRCGAARPPRGGEGPLVAHQQQQARFARPVPRGQEEEEERHQQHHHQAAAAADAAPQHSRTMRREDWTCLVCDDRQPGVSDTCSRCGMNRPTEEAKRIAQQRKAAAAAKLDRAQTRRLPDEQYSHADIVSETIDAYEAYYYGS